MNNSKILTTKRKQIDKAKARQFGVLVGAAFISVLCLVAAKSFFTQANYLNKVASVKEKAVKQLKDNKTAVTSLRESYTTFASQSPNLIGGSPQGTSERDGDNGRLVLDALPSSYDFPALATSIEKLLTGYSINSINGTDDSATQDAVNNKDESEPAKESKSAENAGSTSASSSAAEDTPVASAAVEIPFSMAVTTTYPGFQDLVKKIDQSIRPFQFTTLSLSGTNGILQADMSLKTYYQPESGLSIQKKVIK